jgi:hypothetical protein
MALNGISELATKELRQKAKLDLAATNRAEDGNPRSTYDLTLLPTQFNNGDIINNPNAGGLVVGRPWINTVSAFTFFEAFGTTATISTTQYVSGNKIYAESSSYDVSIPAPPARVVVNDIEVLRQGDTPNPPGRGHNLVILDSYGDVVTAATQYDTWDTVGSPGASTALASALGAVTTGNIIVLVSYDASALTAGVRSAINTGYGSTNSNTWTSERRSHIFIGEKLAVAPTPSIRALLSGTGQTAFDAASDDSFFAVSQTDYDAVVAGVASVSTVGPSDAQFASGPGSPFSAAYIVTYPQAAATVPANNYIIGFKAVTATSNSQWRIYGGPTFKSTSPVYSQISTASPSTGAGAPGIGTFYYLRKAPTVQAATTYIGIYGTQTLVMTATGTFTGGGYTNAPFTAWSNWTMNMPKVQVIITPTTVV